MKAFCKIFVLLLATVGLASCGGGGGGGSNSAFGPVSQVVTVTPASASISTNSFTSIVVRVAQQDGAPAPDGQGVSLALSPLTIGTVSGDGATSGTTAINSTSGGQASFIFNSSNQAGTAHFVASVSVKATGDITGTYTFVGQANITVTQGNVQDPRLQLTATTHVLPVNPFIGQAQSCPSPSSCFVTNYIGSPYIAEVGVVWRHSNGALVSGTLTVNDSITPTAVAALSELDDPATNQQDKTKADGNEFLTLVGSEPVNVTGGVGTIYVHSAAVPGTAQLTVTAIDPDNGQTISSQLIFTVAGPATGVPSSIIASSGGGLYISGSNGPQSAVLTATVYDGSNSFVADPNAVDNVQFTIVGPANNDGRLVAINAAGQQNTGTTVSAATHNGVATATFQGGTQQGPVQVKMTADRADNNVDNGISDPVSATTTVVVSDGKLFSLTIDSPDTGAVNASGVSANAVEDPVGSGNYELTLSAKGVDRQGNPVLPGTVIGWGDIDSPQVVNASTGPQGWFQISGSRGDPQEGGKLFTATDGHFKTAGGGSGPGDTLLVIGKASEGAPALNDDLESSDKITAVNTETSLNVATPFNLNDKTGVVVNNHDVLPYIIGRATFSSVQSPAFTDDFSSQLAGVAETTLNYPASAIGKAVAVWAQGTGTNTNTSPGLTDVVADIAVIVFPGSTSNSPAYITASPDPILGNTQVFETVCYYDGNNRPIPNYDISFAFNFGGVGSGSADGVSQSGKFQHLTGPNGCVTVSVITASVPSGTSSTSPSVTFSAGPINSGGGGASMATVTVPIVVNAAQLQVSCPAGVASGAGTNFTVDLRLIDSAGAGVSGSGITATCQATPPGSITAGTILPTDANGHTEATITVNPTGTVGRCVFQSAAFHNLVGSIDFTAGGAGTCQGGFSPPPN